MLRIFVIPALTVIRKYGFLGFMRAKIPFHRAALSASLRTLHLKKMKQPESPGPGWGTMLTMLAVAILLAALIAYRMIYPFFHRHPAH